MRPFRLVKLRKRDPNVNNNSYNRNDEEPCEAFDILIRCLFGIWFICRFILHEIFQKSKPLLDFLFIILLLIWVFRCLKSAH
jgi:hypothetical protein